VAGSKQGAHHLALRDRIRERLTLSGRWGKSRFTVLGARQEVTANVIGQRQVARSVERRMGQRGSTSLAPVFNRGIRVDNLRLHCLRIAGENAVPVSGRIGLLEVCVRKTRRGK